MPGSQFVTYWSWDGWMFWLGSWGANVLSFKMVIIEKSYPLKTLRT